MLRQIRRSPGFFFIATLLLSLGIAASTLIFTLVDALLLSPLPVRDPQNLVQLFELQQKRPAEPYFDYRFYKQLVAGSSTLFDIAGQAEVTRIFGKTRNGGTCPYLCSNAELLYGSWRFPSARAAST